ncbi:hypothetical protein D0865_14134 [Hortaea werneckii]|uniref:Uncharacterized protein n=1 Tax=Hortaea werneckii TaxID=91943 RepID=A0A3M7B4C7_HORWE|nr:hypothetical protein D0865_14134 [Hortaea werneckii]
MFAGKPRPVPSKAALDVLYQLAYISSGAAVGVATLCAEERRRRTQVVQKIAENAKRIRQSPRYYQNAAVATQESHDYMAGHGGTSWDPETVEEPAGTKRRRRRPRDSMAAQAPGLPSVVEDGYAQVQSAEDTPHPNKPRHRRRIAASHGPHPAPWRLVPGTAGVPSGDLTSEGTEHSSTSPKAAHANSTVKSRDLRRDQNLGHAGQLRSVEKGLGISERWSTLLGKRCKEPAELASEFHRRRVARRDEAQESPGHHASPTTETNVTHEVDSFFTTAANREHEIQGLVHMSNQLLQASLVHGTLDDVRSLCLWKFSQESSIEQDAEALCKASQSLAERVEHKELFEFYVNLFSEDKFWRIESRNRLRLAISVLAQAVRWDVGLSLQSAAHKLLAPLLQDTAGDELDRTLLEQCHSLIDNDCLRQAADILQALRKLCRHNHGYRESVELVLDVALRDNRIPLCSKLLRIANQTLPENILAEKHNAFLRICDEHKAYDTITNLFINPQGGGRRPTSIMDLKLNENSYEILAFACTQSESWDKGLRRAFSYTFAKVPEARQGRILEARSSLSLRRIWDSTRDLGKVISYSNGIEPWLRENATLSAMRSWRLALLEIFISAGKIDLAKNALDRFSVEGLSSSDSVSLALLMLANKGRWESLDRLLAIAEESRALQFDSDTTERFNQTLDFYVRQHSSIESWKFVSRAVDKLGFRPNHVTTEVMLKAFVSAKSIDMIPKWLRYVHTLGRKFEVTARVASMLLTRFYRDFRPPHVLIMWFCRNLMSLAPSLAGTHHYVPLLKEAIGFDIRKNGETRAHGDARLQLLEGIKGTVALPRPGYIWDGRLTLSQPESGDVQESSAPPTASPSVREKINGTGTPPEHIQGDTDSELPSMIHFGELRDVYDASDRDQSNSSLQDQRVPVNDGQIRASHDSDPVYDMILALSLKDYVKVSELYHISLDASGLPTSPLALEIAVEACIRLHRGERTAAEGLMTRARDAGMNVTCAMGPMLIHQIYHLKSSDKKDANNLRITTIEYYRMNDEKGWPVKHHVGVTAANTLINNGMPEHGLNILQAIYNSGWASRRPLGIEAITVFLKGYAALFSVEGMEWVLGTVLHQQMRIDHKFLRTLRRAVSEFARNARAQRPTFGQESHYAHVHSLAYGLRLSRERRTDQLQETKVLGRRLIACLAKNANYQQQPQIQADSRHELEDTIFGASKKVPRSTSGQSAALSPRRARRAENYQQAVARAIRAEKSLGRRGRRLRAIAADDVRWHKQYRAYLRKPLVMSEGKLASFRYTLPTGLDQS